MKNKENLVRRFGGSRQIWMMNKISSLAHLVPHPDIEMSASHFVVVVVGGGGSNISPSVKWLKQSDGQSATRNMCSKMMKRYE